MVKTGLEVLIGEQLNLLAGKRVGLVSHPAAVLPDLTRAVDALLSVGVKLTTLFGPEHGFSGIVADGAEVADEVEPYTRLPVFSLYGAILEPTPAMLAGVDVLLFDMQDVGVRFYTYMSTLFYVLRSAARAAKPVVVLDRPNPITGVILEGPGVEPEFLSFVGIIPVPIRHGLTLGEMARFMNVQHGLGAELTVIEMQGWRRGLWFDQTGLPWTLTSPAIPHFETTILYPGMCLLEGTNLSVGRGTALPFEVCGAPWVDGHALADALNRLELSGARFRPTQFTPAADRFAGQVCHGVQVHVADRRALRPVALGLYLIAALRRLYPEHFAWAAAHFDLLLGSSQVRQALDEKAPVEEIMQPWKDTLAQFDSQRFDSLLYAPNGVLYRTVR